MRTNERDTMTSHDLPEGTQYLVCGLKFNPNPELDGMASSSVEILGAFSDLSKAVLCRDIYSDLDTTMEAVTITPSIFMEDIPDFDVFLSITVDADGITVRSQCVAENTEPWLREEPDFFEALAYPEDENRIIELASSWFEKRAGYFPPIIDDVSKQARSMMTDQNDGS